MKAVISGAGIAGLTLGGCLAEKGWQVTILDEGSAARGEGYMIELFGSGFEAARRMGLLPRLEEVAYDIDYVRWRNASGRTTARLPYRTLQTLFDGRLMGLMRSDLEQILIQQLPATVELRFRCRVAQVRTPVGHVDVELSSGEVEHADVLIGADGVRSRIRDLVFGEGSLWWRYLGFHTAAFVIHAPDLCEALRSDLHILSVPGREVGLFAVRDGNVAAFFVHRAPLSAHPRSSFEALAAAYGDLGWHVPQVLGKARELPTFLYEQVGQVVLPHWYRGRIALLGDACQAVSLLPGQGASLSLAASYVLAEELNREGDVKAALARYEHRVRPPLAQLRRAGRRAADWLVPATPAGILTRDAAIRLASIRGLSRLLRPVVNAAREDVIVPPA
jgi:2-polyprenyl-6-methoxyphenol hydroxylase-like FAD-dependent oxidoreductase